MTFSDFINSNGIMRTRGFLFLLGAVCLLCGCNKEDEAQKREEAWKQEKKSIIHEMSGEYEGEVVHSDAPSTKHDISFSMYEFGYIKVIGERIDAAVEISKVSGDSVFLSVPETRYWWIWSTSKKIVGTIYASAGEPKFSGYIGVYDRKTKTIKFSLRIKEVYNGQPDKRVIDYIALYSGTWKSDFQKL